jgi:hypothetical protein
VVIKISTPKEATMHRRKRRILTSLVLGFAVAAIAAPTALGEPRGPGNDPVISVASPDDRTLYRGTSPQLDPSIVGSPDDRVFFRGVETPSIPVNVTVSSPSDGFQWDDAGLGAASTLVLVLLMGAGTLMIRHQRRRIAAF